MDNSINFLETNQPQAVEGVCVRRVLASKIYCIAEEEIQEELLYGSNGNVFVHNEASNDNYEPECSREENDFYENLVIGKEEIQEIISSDSEAFDGRCAEDSTLTEDGDSYSQSQQKANENVLEIAPRHPRILLCPFCRKEFVNILQWRLHLNATHDFHKRETLNMVIISSNRVKCNQCNSHMCSQLQVMQNHRINHLPYSQFVECKLCDKSFKSVRDHTQHLVVIHKLNCGKEGKDDAQSTIYLCPYCGSEFLIYSKWRQHLNVMHRFNKIENINMEYINKNKAKCKECQIILGTTKLQTLQKHTITHLPHKQCYKCKLCGKLSISNRSHNSHYYKTHNEKSKQFSNSITTQTDAIFICPFCGRESEAYFEWRKHLSDIHDFENLEKLNVEFLKNNLAKCKQCHEEVIYNRTWALQEHRIKHLLYDEYIKCKTCEATFSGFSMFARHYNDGHAKPSYLNTNYIPHQLENSPISPIVLCAFCGIEFLNSMTWRQHMNDIHDFNNRESLNIEYITEDKAKCKECNLDLVQRMHCLQAHKITHLPYKKYFKCKLCTKQFASARNHLRHVELRHKEE